MVNIRDGMQDWEYLWAIGHYEADGVTRTGKIASVETARELAEQISVNWNPDSDPAHLLKARCAIAAWLDQPYVASYPVPEHRSKGVSESPTLRWKADSVDVSSFDVYFGTDHDAVLKATPASREFSGNQSATTFNPPGPLATNTNYYWRIDERAGTQVYKGYVWSFNRSLGLVGWWKFDESQGTVAKDRSSFGRDATILNCEHVPGIMNNCLEFDGAGCVQIPTGVLATVDRQISIAFWLCGGEAQPQSEVLFEALTANGNTVLRGRFPFSDCVAYFEAGAGDVVDQTMKLIEARSRWQHWVLTKNADTGHMKIYRNGVLWADAIGKTQIMEPAVSFTLGSKCDGSLGYEGRIDEFRVYDGELQQAEITALYGLGGQRGDRGLMGWWRFDELSGTTVRDWSDLQNHGTLQNADPIREAGKIGNCLTCGGITDYVDVPVNGLTFSDPSITLSVWMYGDASLPNVNSGDGCIAVSALKTDGTKALLAWIPSSHGRAQFNLGGDSGFDQKVTDVLLSNQYKDQWNHWVCVSDLKIDAGGNRIYNSYLYLNGEQLHTDTNLSDPIGQIGQFRIGTGYTGFAYPYVGKLDEIRLYNYGLSADEVKEIYNADLARVSGQVGRWKFDENAGATASDATPFGHDGTIHQALWSNGRIGAALKFDGAGANVSVPPAALTQLEEQVTVTVWLEGAQKSAHEEWIFEALDAAGGPVIRATVGSLFVAFDAGFGAQRFDQIKVEAVASPPTGLVPGGQGLPRGAWSHWAFTKNAVSGVMNIYRNGKLWNSATGKYRPLTTAAVFKIGSKADGTSGYTGVIDDLRIYNLELSPADINDIYLDCPPLPNPMTWSKAPQATGLTSISMAATVASHPNGVEYYFQCVAGGGHDSGWQPSPKYTDSGLAGRTQYSYQVKAREKGPGQNETGLSQIASAITTRLRYPPRFP
jgi:hypothetical protein